MQTHYGRAVDEPQASLDAVNAAALGPPHELREKTAVTVMRNLQHWKLQSRVFGVRNHHAGRGKEPNSP